MHLSLSVFSDGLPTDDWRPRCTAWSSTQDTWLASVSCLGSSPILSACLTLYCCCWHVIGLLTLQGTLWLAVIIVHCGCMWHVHWHTSCRVDMTKFLASCCISAQQQQQHHPFNSPLWQPRVSRYKLCGYVAATICPRPTLTFDLLTLKSVWESHVTCAKFRLPRPFGFRVRADVRDIRRTPITA